MSGRPLVELPKAHLHVHLEGCMRPETLGDLAAEHGMKLPETRGYADFSAFSAMYRAACTVLRTPADLARLVTEIVEDAALAGAAWVEPAFYAPFHEEMMGTPEAVVELVLATGADAAARTGVGVGFMISANRSADPDDALAQAKLAARYASDGVVSFGLANDEALFPPEPFAEAYRVTRDAGLLSTPHAGELAGPASVVGALDALGADRIQHGVRAVEDTSLLERLADEGICLDVCPTSNVALAVVTSIKEGAPARCAARRRRPLQRERRRLAAVRRRAPGGVRAVPLGPRLPRRAHGGHRPQLDRRVRRARRDQASGPRRHRPLAHRTVGMTEPPA